MERVPRTVQVMHTGVETTGGLLQIAAAASTFDDRRAGVYVRSASAQEAAAGRLAQWRELIAPAGEAAFERRLAWDGLDDAAARRLLGDAVAVEGAPPPSWLETFRRAYGASRAEVAAAFRDVALPDRVLDAGNPVAFEDLFLPLIRYARSQVRERSGSAYGLLHDEAHAALERALLRRVSHICERALYASFSVERACRQADSFRALLAGPDARPGGLYAGFVRRMQAGGLFDFFCRYSVAARLCATVVDLWIEATAEFLARLQADLPALRAVFGIGAGPVVDVRTDLGDAHEGGRAVMIARFACGARVVYKPRPVGIEAVFAGLAAWVNRQPEAVLALRIPHILARQEYGWLEFIDHLPCGSIEEVRRFYQRTGMLLALVYALNGSDFHLENLIASGEHPVLIDMEALLVPELEPEATGEEVRGSEARVRELFQASVARTGLLPIHMWSSDQRSTVDMGALSSADGTDAVAELIYWSDVNTDLMRAASLRVDRPVAGPNVPRLGDVPCYVDEYVEDVVEGFSRVYRLLCARRADLLAPGGTVERLRTQRIRFLFRATNLYASVLERGLHPRYLVDGRDRFVQLDVLARPLLIPNARPHAFVILETERQSLERMDVPLFSVQVDSRTLQLPGEAQVPGFFRRTAYEQVVAKLCGLGEEDLAFQVGIIRAAFRANAARGPTPPRARHHGPPPERDGEPERFFERAMDRAERIAEALRRRAITSPEGGASWVGIGYLSLPRRHTFGPLTYSLFDGYCGIGLFLAAFVRCGGGPEYRDLALDAVWSLRDGLDVMGRKLAARRIVDLGALTGLASAAYALARMGSLLGEPDLLRDAARMASWITPQLIERDRSYDAASGSAGAILGLLAVHGATGEERLLAQAGACARHLLAHRTVDPASGLRVWLTRGERGELGIAHGAAGIAFALLRLHARTGDAELLEAAEEAMLHERHARAQHQGGEDAPGVAGWSCGIPGLGFAQLEAPEGSGAREGLEVSLRLTEGHLFDEGDDLCSGSLGRVDLLLTAGLAAHDAGLVARARRAADAILVRAEARGRFELGWGEGVPHFGLFPGLTGIAYELLRVAQPDAVPSVLSWA